MTTIIKRSTNLKYFAYKHRKALTLIGIPLASLVFVGVVNGASPTWTITAPFGDINSMHTTPHKGVDFAMPIGTPLDSIVDGTVQDVRYTGSKGWGTSIHIRDNAGRDIIYGHLSEVKVKIGETVQQGDLIGLSGNTGRSSGAHLHLQININGKPINPMRDIVRAGLGSRSTSIR